MSSAESFEQKELLFYGLSEAGGTEVKMLPLTHLNESEWFIFIMCQLTLLVDYD